MKNQMNRKFRAGFILFLSVVIASCILLTGCNESNGYSGESLFPDEVQNVYVEMFGNETFRRGIEYQLSNAVAKRIEAETPYKIITSRDRADSVMSGKIISATESVLTIERQTGRPLEMEVEMQVVVNWKNLKTGELLLDNQIVTDSAAYSKWQNQFFDYASGIASNNVAREIVQQMEKQW